MGINTSFISNKNSKEVINNSPKLPLATDLADGEIAVNFAKDYETLAIKNESGDVVTFSSDNKFYKKSETSGATEIQTALGNKQDILVSGTNIKTINNTSILGSGNITIEGGSGSQIQSDWDESDITSDAYIKNRPFYGSIGYTVIYNETINCEQNGPTHGGTNFTPTEELIVGKTYKVTIDSDEYVVKAVSPTALNLNENWSTPFNDTWSIFKLPYNYTICINGAIGQTKSVKIEKQYSIVEKQIDSEYVDLSNYYNKTECDNKYLTAQTQSDWNQNYQYSASFIKNKPFGVETYVKSEKVYEGTFTRSTYSTEEFKQVYWDGNISTNILSVGDYIRLVINSEDRGDYTKVVSNSNSWKVNYSDSANGYSLYPGSNAQLNFYGVGATPATNLPSGDTISVEIWKCTLGETKLDNKYVDYENSSYIKSIENSIPKIWTGTQSEYDAITNKDSSTIYFIK